MNAIALGLLAGSLLYDRGRWLSVRPRWFDLPILVWCFSPLVTAVSNALLFHDPVSRYDPDFLPRDAGLVGRLVFVQRDNRFPRLFHGADLVLERGEFRFQIAVLVV